MQTRPRARGVTLGWILLALIGSELVVAWLFETAIVPGVLSGGLPEEEGARVVQQAE